MRTSLVALLTSLLLLSACATPPPKAPRPRPSTWIIIGADVEEHMDKRADAERQQREVPQ